MRSRTTWLWAAGLALLALGPTISASAASPASGPYTAADWTALAKLPDFSGVWVPDVNVQRGQITSNPPPWTAKVAAEAAQMAKDELAGHPHFILRGCQPYGMPALMLIPHNAMEILYTPGRVTILGESDGNRLRRIYTDGRKTPDDPDITSHGASIGHWDGGALVVETTAIAPQSLIAVSEGVGIPNDGGMNVVERIHLTGPDLLADDLIITAPKVLTRPWRTTRIWRRIRGEKYEIIEGECEQGMLDPQKDKNGHDVFVPIPERDDGAPIPVAKPTP